MNSIGVTSFDALTAQETVPVSVAIQRANNQYFTTAAEEIRMQLEVQSGVVPQRAR